MPHFIKATSPGGTSLVISCHTSHQAAMEQAELLINGFPNWRFTVLPEAGNDNQRKRTVILATVE